MQIIKLLSMKKYFVVFLAILLTVSSCGTYAGSGAYAGATFGSILGSAIGGISDGPRGHDIGTIIGMAGGAVIGGAIGNAQDQQRQADLEQYRRDKAERQRARQQQQYDTRTPENGYDSGFDASNSGDDRLYDFSSSDYTNTAKGKQPVTMMPMQSSVEELAQGLTYTPTIEIRNARFLDADGDNVIRRGELCKVIFEVYNRGQQTIYDVQPTVVEATGNRHIFVSPGMHVERIEPGQGIRYTAMVKADNKLREGSAKICISVIQGNNHKISKVSEFNIPTRR